MSATGNAPSLSLYDEYAAITQLYRSMYGGSDGLVVVLMEVGSFLEWYDGGDGRGADVQRVCALLNVQATRKNKTIAAITRTNPAFGGVPRVAAAKYIQVLVDAGYSVVMAMQVTPPPNPKRAVTEVISKSTCAASDFVSTAISSHATAELMAVYIAGGGGGGGGGGGREAVGWALIDLSTGRSRAGEEVVAAAPSAEGDPTRALDRIRGIALSAQPSEAIVLLHHGDDAATPTATMESLCTQLGLCRRTTHEREPRRSPAYQNEVLARAFPSTGFLTPAEFIDMELMPYALTAFVALLQFAYEHNENVIRRIQRPELSMSSSSSVTELGSETPWHLGLVPAASNGGSRPNAVAEGDLVSMFNRCKTVAGRRAFRDRLLRPLTSPMLIDQRLDAVAAVLAMDEVHVEWIAQALGRVGDIERIHRRLCVRRGTVAVADLAALASSMSAAIDAVHDVTEAAGSRKKAASDAAKRIESAITSRLNLLAAAGGSDCSTASPLFIRGVHEDVDRLQDELDAARAVFHDAARALNAAIGAEHVRVEADDGSRMMMHLTVTARRWTAAVASGAVARAEISPWFKGSDVRLVSPTAQSGTAGAAGGVRLLHPALDAEASMRVSSAAAALDALQRRKLADLADELADGDRAQDIALVVKEIEELDVTVAVARNAREFNHVRPTVVGWDAGGGDGKGEEEGGSYACIAGLRHPVIEALPDRLEAYVPNDVSIGTGVGIGVGGGRGQRGAGMLLYGVNAVGKSSTMKAVGLAAIMAQAGMYVACTSMELRPFLHVHTRIGLHDDLRRGRSTFMVEMLELRAILRRADKRTLVIGDELCAGTESASALSIVGAGVVSLARRGASFIFATHLHELVKLPPVAELIEAESVRPMHLSVHYDAATGGLVMDRRLMPGTGRPTYGLEVCRSLDMDPEFMRTAEAIRRHVLGVPDELVRPRVSRYNRKVIVDRCAVCGAQATETHHIVHQARADAAVRNRRHNLVALCDACHKGVHAGALHIGGYKVTSEGVRLMHEPGCAK